MSRSRTIRLVTTTTLVGSLALASVAPAYAETATPEVATTESSAPETSAPTTEPSVPAPMEPPTTAEMSAPAAAARITPRVRPAWTVNDLLRLRVTLVRGDRGTAVVHVQRQLTAIGLLTRITGVWNHQSQENVARFNEKFRGFEAGENNSFTPGTWKALKRVTRRLAHIPRSCYAASRVLCVSKAAKVVRLMIRGKVVMSLDARFGRPGEETRNGNFSISRKVINDYSTMYKSPMPWSMYFSGGQAIHFSYYFRMDGYWGASHGCVNLRDMRGAIKMWKSVPLGTKTVVY